MPSISFLLKALWTRAMLRGVHYRNRYQQLDLMYLITDPWNLDNPRDRFRFEKTNRLIRHEFGHVASVLEVGCGEGYHSQYLARVCDRLHGCDVSARAVERARRRCPTSTFSVGTLSDILADGGRVHDLVVACEALYHMNDIQMQFR
ncbi:MAG: class I SAM-dependent methyltransferase [Methylocella sp.]